MSVTSVPKGSVAVTDPRFAYGPRLAVPVAVQVLLVPGARLPLGQLTVTPGWSSATWILRG